MPFPSKQRVSTGAAAACQELVGWLRWPSANVLRRWMRKKCVGRGRKDPITHATFRQTPSYMKGVAKINADGPARITETTRYVNPDRIRGHRTVRRKWSLDGPFIFAVSIDGVAVLSAARRRPSLCAGDITSVRPLAMTW